MVDYSKWDKFDVSDSDDDGPRGPTVTKFDKASTITIPGATKHARTGASLPEVHVVPSMPDDAADDAEEARMSHEEYFKSFEEAESTAAGGTSGVLAPHAATAASSGSRPDWTRNGYATDSFMFCQGLNEVTICVFAPIGTRAKDVNVTLSPSGELAVQVCAGVVVRGQLSHEVTGMARTASTQVLASARDSDEEVLPDAEEIDWEVIDDVAGSRRLVRITLTKRPPAGLKVWWRKFFKEDVLEVDVANIAGREPGGVDAVLGRKLTMQEVWERAHAEFRAKIAAQRPMEIGSDSDE